MGEKKSVPFPVEATSPSSVRLLDRPDTAKPQMEFRGTYKLTSGVESYPKEWMLGLVQIRSNGGEKYETQDAHLRSDRHGIYIVADGAGSYEGSETASQVATTAFFDAVASRNRQLKAFRHDNNMIVGLLRDALVDTDEAILRTKQEVNKYGDNINQACTTLTSAIYLGDNKFAFVNVGDSAAFVVNPQGDIEQVTTEQSKEGVLQNALTGTGRQHSNGSPLTSDEIIIKELEPGSNIMLCTDGLLGNTPEQKIDHQEFAKLITKHSHNLAGAARALVERPSRLYCDDNFNPYPGAIKPKIDDTTALVINVAEPVPKNAIMENVGKYAAGLLQRASSLRQQAESPTNEHSSPELTQEPVVPSLVEIEAAHNESEQEPAREKRRRRFGKALLGKFQAAKDMPLNQFNKYAYGEKRRDYGKLARFGSTAIKTAILATSVVAAAKLGAEIAIPYLGDTSTIASVFEGAEHGLGNFLDNFSHTIEGHAIPAPNAPKPFELPNLTIQSPGHWDGNSSDIGYYNGTVYNSVGETITKLAHDNNIHLDFNELRQQHPDTYEQDYHRLVDQVLTDNHLSWDDASHLADNSSLTINKDHINDFFANQDVTLPKATNLNSFVPPAPEHYSLSPLNFAEIGGAVVATVATVGAISGGGFMAANAIKRRRKNQYPSEDDEE